MPKNTLHEKIVKAWKKTRLTHPTYREIAEQVGCSKYTVHAAVNKHLETLKKK